MGLRDNENKGLGNSIIAQSHNSTIPQFHNPCDHVFINAAQYFDNVPEAAWEFFIGGYQPAQKWLKD